MKTGSLLAVIVFTLVAVAHLVRLATGTVVVVGEYTAPLWISGIGVLVPGLIAWLLWKESR